MPRGRSVGRSGEWRDITLPLCHYTVTAFLLSVREDGKSRFPGGGTGLSEKMKRKKKMERAENQVFERHKVVFFF